jgi:epoxyqueuosine reductase
MIKAEAKRLGFDECGIAKASVLKEDALHLKYWLDHNMHGNMKYMENYFDKRIEPDRLLKGTRSVISVFLNYYTDKTQKDNTAPKISKYACGKDYHIVIKEKLNRLLDYINNKVTDVKGRTFVDSAPLLERAWAARSGLGWIGKNSNLISVNHGSFVFIGTLLIDCELEYDNYINNNCGDCNKCITACPTNAIVAPKIIDARRCISYLTVENKNTLPEEYKGKFHNYIFGCDICQDVCPWNEKASNNNIPDFKPLPKLFNMTKQEWYDLDKNRFTDIIKDSTIDKKNRFFSIEKKYKLY